MVKFFKLHKIRVTVLPSCRKLYDATGNGKNRAGSYGIAWQVCLCTCNDVMTFPQKNLGIEADDMQKTWNDFVSHVTQAK